jgi:RiboL-PSP-HEPN
MNNQFALTSLNDCNVELAKLQQIIDVFGQSHSIVPFLTNYAVIKCCGTIENCFKIIISDFHNALPIQAKNYIESTFLYSSMNPSKANICKSLSKFDEQWNSDFKSKLAIEPDKSRIESSLGSLNEARNAFAHGGNPGVSFASVVMYFNDSRRIIEILDEVIV